MGHSGEVGSYQTACRARSLRSALVVQTLGPLFERHQASHLRTTLLLLVVSTIQPSFDCQREIRGA